MKKATKTLLVISGICAAAGISLCVAGFLMGGSLRKASGIFSFSGGGEDLTDEIKGFEPSDSKWEEVSFTDVKNLDFDLSAGELQMKPYDGDEIRVYTLKKDKETQVRKEGNTLILEDRNPVVHLMGSSYPVMVLIPEEQKFREVELDVSAGSGTVKDLQADTLEVDMSAGELEFTGNTRTRESSWDVSAGSITVKHLRSRRIDVDVSAGELDMELEGSIRDYSLNGEVTAGELNYGDQTWEDSFSVGDAETGRQIEAECTAGEINITFSES